MSRITREEVERTARLARLDLEGAEIEALTRDLGQVLEHAAELARLDTTGIEPTAHAFPLATPLRRDVAAAALDPELALANAPVRAGTAFVVPKVLEGEES